MCKSSNKILEFITVWKVIKKTDVYIAVVDFSVARGNTASGFKLSPFILSQVWTVSPEQVKGDLISCEAFSIWLE